MISMRLAPIAPSNFRRKRLLLLALLLGLQLALTNAGFFDNLAGKLNMNNAKKPAAAADSDDPEGDRLAEELARLDGRPAAAAARPAPGSQPASRKANKFSNMMAAMKHKDEQVVAAGPASRPSARDFMKNKHGDGQPEAEAARPGRPAKPGQTLRPPGADDKDRRSFGDKMLHGIKVSYQKTKEGLGAAGQAVVDLPAQMSKAGDSFSAMLKLDSRGRLLSMVGEVDDDLAFVRREFSSFSISWSKVMESSLSYVGFEGLEKLKKLDSDEFDFRRDALNAAAFGYEFMRLMMSWREELLTGHHAYRAYLQQVIDDQARSRFTVDEEFMYQLEVIHNYILLNCWMELDNISLESKMKLDYLMFANDMRPKNYESQHFRNIIVLQELYDPTGAELMAERKQVIEALSEAKGVSDEQFEEIDDYLADFRNALVDRPQEHPEVDWECPEELIQFMARVGPELKYNRIVYERPFLLDLKAAKERTMAEMYAR